MFSVAQLEQLNTGISRVKRLNPTGAARAFTEKKKKRISHDSLMNSSSPTSPTPVSAGEAFCGAIDRYIGVYQK